MNQEIRDMIEMFFFIILIFALGGLAVQGVCLIFGIPPFGYLQSVGIFTAIIFFLISVAATT
ncbi:hypothetical protein C4A75_09440 [Brevibacillus laterosporus]|uniref:hypothetical protein n=1 Tax=Brevibacillus laterosporus TaxID=1465 RepID=UPI000CE3E9C4|nr:hypothetical protein [Brevibacillus laterosporus]PPA84990.1 hypothetical protein C4A75_09440 [Brevibacillus laterosporus]